MPIVSRLPRAAAGGPFVARPIAPERHKPDAWLARLCSAPVPQLLIAAVLTAVLPWAVYRAVGNLTCDLPEFIAGGAHVLKHGCRHPFTALDRYLPSLDVACIALTVLPLDAVAVLYYLFNIGSWFALLFTVQNGLLSHVDAHERSRATMAASLLVLVIAIDGFIIGAFHVLMVWLMTAGLASASRDRPWRGGVLLGLAVWLKLLPIIGVGYLLVKRKWHAASLAIAVAVAIDLALSLAAFGPQGTLDEHHAWAAGGVAGSFDRQMNGHDYINEDRITNQSIPVLLRRFLTARAGFSRLSLADLSPQTLSIVTGGVLLALGAAVLAVIRRPATSLTRAAWETEIALMVLCTVWFSPVVWSYHLTAALPALAVIMARSTAETRKQVVALVWIVGLALFAVPLTRAAGNMLWASLFVGLMLVWPLPAALPSAESAR